MDTWRLRCLLSLLFLASHSQASQAGQVCVLVDSLPLAGFQFYTGRQFWDEMQPGDQLSLHREPDNPHDRYAVRVDWQGHPLGHLPRPHNRPAAQALDAGYGLQARIGQLQAHRNPWKRLRIDLCALP
ncbi:MAG: HIRAN domain-containing protein [Rhodocyclales bacterium]|nr:HIRAN domain-containing protein [Rhodocyclales bacterium]